jgi:hypothetical protein
MLPIQPSCDHRKRAKKGWMWRPNQKSWPAAAKSGPGAGPAVAGFQIGVNMRLTRRLAAILLVINRNHLAMRERRNSVPALQILRPGQIFSG